MEETVRDRKEELIKSIRAMGTIWNLGALRQTMQHRIIIRGVGSIRSLSDLTRLDAILFAGVVCLPHREEQALGAGPLALAAPSWENREKGVGTLTLEKLLVLQPT